MYEQQDAVLRQATADLLQRAPGHELQSPANKLFQNAREHAASPDPALQPVVDQVVADEELAHANDFWKFFALPIAINVYAPHPTRARYLFLLKQSSRV